MATILDATNKFVDCYSTNSRKFTECRSTFSQIRQGKCDAVAMAGWHQRFEWLSDVVGLLPNLDGHNQPAT